jgi:hypothetical protein
MSNESEKKEGIWDVVFQPHKPVRVVFHGADFETDYVFEAKNDHGIFVRDKRKILYIPWLAVDYIAWRIDAESKKEKGEETKEKGDASV